MSFPVLHMCFILPGLLKERGTKIGPCENPLNPQNNITLKIFNSDNWQASIFIIQLARQRHKSTNDAHIIFNQKITKCFQAPCISTWVLEVSLCQSASNIPFCMTSSGCAVNYLLVTADKDANKAEHRFVTALLMLQDSLN